MTTELDTMNEMAESKEDHNMDVIADMAPPPRGWNDMPQPPPPPEPPPCRLECSSCGYIAPEPEFHKNHPYCKVGYAVWGVFGFVVILFVGSIVATILHGLGINI